MKRFSANALFKKRIVLDLSCRDLSDLIFQRTGVWVSQSTISRWETGGHRPRLDLYAATCEALGVDYADLMEDVDESK